MTPARSNRRRFLQTSSGIVASAVMFPDWLADLSYGAQTKDAAPSDRPVVGSIGVGGQGTGIMNQAHQSHLGQVAAVCDVDQKHAERARDAIEKKGGKAEVYADFRKLLERPDINIVTIGTPDHWHTKIAIEAMLAGKDVYCEKPLTLTIAEGQQLIKVAEQTKRILQVGTQQRSQSNLTFLRAVATARSGQLGKLSKVTVSLPLSTPEGDKAGPFATKPAPENLDWEVWLGQTPKVEYCPERCHFTFRWWYEYSGGIVTDWGAHHMDIAQWTLDAERSGPLTIDGSQTKLPMVENGYNTPRNPVIVYTYPGDVIVEITTGNEGVLIEGEKGRIYVNRGRVTGKPIEDQEQDKSLQDQTNAMMTKLYHGSKPGSHMANFFEAVKNRTQPVSDVVSQHRSVSACHLGNISVRLGRKLAWDAAAEKFVGDDEANKMLSREQREPYQIRVS